MESPMASIGMVLSILVYLRWREEAEEAEGQIWATLVLALGLVPSVWIGWFFVRNLSRAWRAPASTQILPGSAQDLAMLFAMLVVPVGRIVCAQLRGVIRSARLSVPKLVMKLREPHLLQRALLSVVHIEWDFWQRGNDELTDLGRRIRDWLLLPYRWESFTGWSTSREGRSVRVQSVERMNDGRYCLTFDSGEWELMRWQTRIIPVTGVGRVRILSLLEPSVGSYEGKHVTLWCV